MTTINTPSDRIVQIRNRQLDFFRSGCTLDLNYRKAQLRRLGDALTRWESRLCDALKEDLHKSYEEAVMTELSIVAGEIRSHIRHLRRWAAPVCRHTPLKLFPSRSRVVSQPLGNALIIAPWNYPVQLLLNPRRHILRMYRRAQTISICAACVRGHKDDDRGEFSSGLYCRSGREPHGKPGVA